MFKNFIKYFLLFAVPFIFSCEKQEGTALISLRISSDNSTTEVVGKSTTDSEVFTVKVLDSNSDVCYEFDDHNDIPETLALTKGSYKVIAYSAQEQKQAVFDEPYYYGETSFYADINDICEVKVECSHSLVKVSVEYSDELSEYMNSYETVVSNGDVDGTLTFGMNPTQFGYFMPNDGEFTYTLSGENRQGEQVEIVRTVTGLKVADFLQIQYEVDKDNELENANAIFDIKVNTTLTIYSTGVTILVDNNGDIIMPEEMKMEFANSDGDKYDFTTDVVDVFYPSTTSVISSIDSPEGLGYLEIRFKNREFGTIPQSLFNLATATSDDIALYAANGIDISFTKVNDKITSATIDMTAMTGMLEYSATEDYLVYEVEITALDVYEQYKQQVVPFRVYSKQHQTVNATLSSTTSGDVTLNARYLTDPIDGMTLVYKTVGSSSWTIIDDSDLDVNTTDKTYSATVNLPISNSTEYTLNTAIVSAGQITELGDAEITFKVVTVATIPNMSFDDWYASGDTWYPMAEGDDTFWSTGNPGLTSIFVGEDSNTTPDETYVISGKSAKLVSVDGITVVGKAAGNLFTGTYSTNISNPDQSVSFGQPFTGRPVKLNGYYMYQPAYNASYTDMCHIYMQLNDASGNVVGYAELKDANTTTEYQYFSLEIEYTSDATVAEIALVITSSHEGGVYENSSFPYGNAGSTLYVDEFSFSYVFE